MYSQNEDTIKALIAQYQQKIFALALYLVGRDRDNAYGVCASSFTEAIRESSYLEQKEVFLVRLAGIVVEKCRNTKAIPIFDELEFLDLPAAEKMPLGIVLKALQALDFDSKALVLLRDQLNLLYKEISVIMRVSETDARRKTARARALLREKIEEIMRCER